MFHTFRPLCLTVALLGLVAPAFSQNPHPPAPTQLGQVVAMYEGTEGNNSYLKFVVHQNCQVIKNFGVQGPEQSAYQRVGDRITITFANCVYQGILSNNVLAGTACVTEGLNVGRTWQFSVEVRNQAYSPW